MILWFCDLTWFTVVILAMNSDLGLLHSLGFLIDTDIGLIVIKKSHNSPLPSFPWLPGFLLRLCWKKFRAFMLMKTFLTSQFLQIKWWDAMCESPEGWEEKLWLPHRKLWTAVSYWLVTPLIQFVWKLNLLIKMDINVQILEIPFLICSKLYNCQIFMV